MQRVQRVQREEQGNPTDNPELPNVRKLERSSGSLVEREEPEFKVDLRIEGVAQDVILRYEGRLGKIQEVVENSEMAHAQNPFLKILEYQKTLCNSAKNHVAKFTKWDRYPEPSSAIHA